jgi:hypothetical protein
MEEMRNTYNILFGKRQGMRSLGTHMHRWEDIVRIDIKEIIWKFLNWMHLAQDGDQFWGLVKTVMNIRVL